MSITDPTFIGQVASVTGGVVRVLLRQDMPTTLVMIAGESYRVGQIGAFFRIPLGYTQLYGICTQIGADAAPPNVESPPHPLETEIEAAKQLSGYRWMLVALFGESLGNIFDRGIGQYPTIGDEVHLVTTRDLQIIYGSDTTAGTITLGNIAATTGIPARVDISGLVSRHCSVVGSTGSGKSNLVAVLLESISDGSYPSARALIIDPHGEYPTAMGQKARVYKLKPDTAKGERHLWVPYWALRFSELQDIVMGGFQPHIEAAIRDIVLEMKLDSAALLENPPPREALTADSPIPFSIKRLWFELDDFERRTFTDSNNQTNVTLTQLEIQGNHETLTSNRYPPPTSYNTPPFPNRQKRHINRQLDFMRSRLQDMRFDFLLNPGEGFSPDFHGRIENDLDNLVRDWVGHDQAVTVLDVSGVPSEIRPLIVGTMLRVIYDTLFWAMDLSVGGRKQPLLIILEEAHIFLPEGGDTPANRTISTIAKEGRKYGVGLMVVTQRPSDIDSAVLSQCGTMISLRLTNSADRGKVAATLPDDLGGLVDLLPALRTGEGLFMGDALMIPSRVRIRKAARKPVGDDPALPDAWQQEKRPDPKGYMQAVANWRAQSESTVLNEEQLSTDQEVDDA